MERRRIIVTRPLPDAERTAAGLAALGLEPVIAPMLEARFTRAALPEPSDFAAVAVTSANAVRALCAHPQGESFAALPVYAVGEATAAEARALGFDRVSSATGTLEALARAIVADRPGPVFYPAPQHQSGDLAGLVAPAGIRVRAVVVYEMVAATALPEAVATELDQGRIAGAVFYSRRTAQVFSRLLADTRLETARRRLACLCLSENVAEPLLEAHFTRIGLADHPSNAAMMTLALAFARDQISP